MSDYDIVIRILDNWIEKHKKILGEFDISEENPTIGFHNNVINELQSIKKEIVILNSLKNCSGIDEFIEILSKEQLSDNFKKLLKELYWKEF